jgi:hypothetical protein
VRITSLRVPCFIEVELEAGDMSAAGDGQVTVPIGLKSGRLVTESGIHLGTFTFGEEE